MNKTITIIILIICSFTSKILSQTNWSCTGPYAGNTDKILTKKDGTIFLNTWQGGLYRSTDNGLTWKKLKFDYNNYAYCFCLKGEKEILVGADKIYSSIDNGDTWSVFSDTYGTYNDFGSVDKILFDSVNNKILITTLSHHKLIVSSDNGITWDHKYMIAENKIIMANGFVYTANQCGARLLRSNDFGENYEEIGPHQVLSLVADSLGILYYTANQVPGVFCSGDSGSTWFRCDSNIGNSCCANLNIGKNNELFISLDRKIYRFQNGSTSLLKDFKSDFAFCTYYNNHYDNYLIACSQDEVILKTTDFVSFSNSSYGVVDYAVSSQNIIYNNLLVTTNGKVFSSSDNGNNWVSLDIPHITYSKSLQDHSGNIVLIDTYYASYDTGHIIRYNPTTLEWAKIDIGLPELTTISDFAIGNDDNYYVITGCNSLYRSYDHGLTWTKNTSIPSSQLSRILVTNQNILVVFSGYGDSIFRSNNWGYNWQSIKISNSCSPSMLNFQVFRTGNKLFSLYVNDVMSFQYSQLFISENDGLTWNEIPQNNYFQPCYIYDAEGVFYSLGIDMNSSNNGIYKNVIAKSEDFGNTWTLIDSIPNCNRFPYFYNLLYHDGKLFLGTTRDGLLSKDISVGINNYRDIKTILVSPNPADDKITIETKSFNKESVLYIYNYKGERMKKCQITREKTTIDISNFQSGLYLIKVQDPNQVRFQKLIKL